jgi:hypothetical protein
MGRLVFPCKKKDTSLNVRVREEQWRIAVLDKFIIYLVIKMRRWLSSRFYLLYTVTFYLGTSQLLINEKSVGS